MTGQRVFVYGTLKRGGSNHRLMARAAFLGTHRTEPAFRMLHLGTYPGALSGGGTALTGEVYRVGPRTLALLDRLEDVPREYVRVSIPTPWGPAWIYLLRHAPRRAREVRGGVWTG
jgi:gamma-glutamylaminecyclotransferase